MPKARVKISGPLNGVRILDLSRYYPGPLATMMLADWGAEVIKIEDPASPDPMRLYPPFVGNTSAGYLAVNRNKRSLTLNLALAEGREIFFRLVKSADVVVESFRPGTLEKMGIDYPRAREANPRIIYISLTGYGQTGPLSRKASHDVNYLALSGLLSITGEAGGDPVLPGAQVADVAGGAYLAVIATLVALWQREQTGEGQQVDVSMLDGTLPLMTLQWAHFQATREEPQRGKMMLSGGLACYNVYPCADGHYVALAAIEPKFWEAFCHFAGKPEWLPLQYEFGEPQEKLKQELRRFFQTRSRDEWMQLAEEQDFCLTPVLELGELPEFPHFKDRRTFVEIPLKEKGRFTGIASPIRFIGQDAAAATSPSEVGENSAEILQELGLTADEIQQLKKKGVV